MGTAFFLLPFFLLSQTPISLPVNFLDQTNDLFDTHNFFCFLDSKGFVWISSMAGLYRFDGNKTIAYLPSEKDSTSIKGQWINGFFSEDKNSNIWFTTYDAINCYVRHKDEFISFTRPNSSQPGYFSCGLDGFSQLWITNGTDLLTFNINSKLFEYKASIMGGADRTHIYLNSNGKVSFTFSYTYEIRQNPGFQLFRFDTTESLEQKIYFNKLPDPVVRVLDIHAVNDSILWVVGQDGLYTLNINNHSWSKFSLNQKQNPTIFRAVEQLNDSILLVATYSNGLYQFNINTKTFNTHYELIYNDHILEEPPQALYKDSAGGIWVSIGHRGLAYYHPDNLLFQHYRYNLETPISSSRIGLNSLIEFDSQLVWGSSNKHGGVIFENETAVKKHYHKHNTPGLKANSTTSSYLDSKGRIWVLTENEPSIINVNGSISSLKTSNSFESICELNSGTIILGARNGGLYRSKFSKESEIHLEKIEHINVDKTYTFLSYQNNGLIYGASNRTHLDIYKNSPEFILMKSIPVNSDIHCIKAVGTEGTLWIGMDKGLYYYYNEEGKPLPIEWAECVAKSIIYGIVPIDDLQIWLSTNNGIFLLNLKDKSCISFGIQHGLGTKKFNRFCYLQRANGYLWFGSSFGITVVNPIGSFKTKVQVPIVNLTNLLVNDVNYPNLICTETGSKNIPEVKSISLPFSDNTLSFYFSVLDYGGIGNSNFEYRMEGVDDEWINNVDRGFARYANLYPGDYTFDVRVAGWNTSVRSIKILIIPPFYHTWWFIVSSAIILIAMVWWLFRLQERRKQKIQQLQFEKRLALESERLRIANDMHDDLGSNLSAVSLRAKVIAQLMGEHKFRDQMDHLIKTTDELSQQVRDTIWTTNSKHDTVDSLVTKLHQYTLEYFKETPIDCKISLMKDRINFPISGDHRRQLFLTFKEVLHNIQKHSDAKIVTVSIKMKGATIIEIIINDNGIGFDANNVHNTLGTGLTSIKMRMDSIKGFFQIHSGKSGTTVILTYPL